MNSIVYIGMDVHKDTFNLHAYEPKTGEIVETKCASDVKLVEKFINKIKERHNNDVEIKTGYEAGCLGYSLHHQLASRGIACDILAPTTMQRSAKNILTKNDRMDAKNIATNLANNSYKAVYIPSDDDVEVKEYLRMQNDFKSSIKKVKQQIKALVLRHGFKFNGKSSWTLAYIKWLKELEMGDLLRETLNEYILQLELLTDKIERFATRIEELSHREKYEQKVADLRCFKGIDTLSAMTLHIEISDFSRFPNAKAFANYVGLIPGDNSSGPKDNRTGITKQGNVLVRTTLIESAQSLVKGTIGSKGKGLKARQKGQDSEVIAYADRGIERLQRKYYKMIHRGVKSNVAITAVARELACFVWGMETGNISN